MAKFRFETEVVSTITLEYFIEADTLEEAIEQLQTGEHRGEGETVDDDIDWGSEIITVEESFEE
jgi:hypothetical protein